jgi:hypothetical protein
VAVVWPSVGDCSTRVCCARALLRYAHACDWLGSCMRLVGLMCGCARAVPWCAHACDWAHACHWARDHESLCGGVWLFLLRFVFHIDAHAHIVIHLYVDTHTHTHTHSHTHTLTHRIAYLSHAQARRGGSMGRLSGTTPSAFLRCPTTHPFRDTKRRP